MKVLIVGLGSIAQKHIEALLKFDNDCEIFALRSSSNSTEFPNINNIYSLNDIPASIDFAIIANPTNLHSEYIISLAAKNISLFIEKPMIHELLSLDCMVDELNDKKIFSYVACNLRFHPCLKFLNKYIKNKPSLYINEVNVYCGSYLPDWRPGKDFKTIYSANAEMGGGVHLDLFHEIDYVCWIFGLPNQTNVHKTSKSSLDINAVDYAHYSLHYNTFTTNITLNYFRKVPKRTIEIVFDNEVWVIDLIKNTITNSINELIFEAQNFTIKDTYYLQLDYFIEKLRKNGEIMNSATESAEILKICLIDE